MNMKRKIACAIFGIVVANIAMAASPNEFESIDIMETVRQSTVAQPFTAEFTGEYKDSQGTTSCSKQLFDGDLTADSNKSADQNGRAMFFVVNGPSVTVSFNPAVFGNRPVYLSQYGFRMGTVENSSWSVANRLPAAWTVYVSNKEYPASGDDWAPIDSRSGLTSASYTLVNSSYYAADFSLESPIAFRHIRFVFTRITGNNTGEPAKSDYVQLGEILMSGLIAPEESERRDICLYETKRVATNADGSATAKVSIVPTGQEVDPYDLFVIYSTGTEVTTNFLENATQFTGLYETTIPGLRLGSNYTLQFGAVAANGKVVLGETVSFLAPLDIMPEGMLPGGFEAVEYIESTDAGNQCIDCGFAPTGKFGFDLDFIGYNEFKRGAYYDKGNRDEGYGCYLTASANLVLSSSTGSNGSYPNGMFLYNGAKNAGLNRNVRMRFLVGDGKYTTIVGTTTNSISFTPSNLDGPNLFLAASCNGAGTTNQYGVMRIYSLKTYNDSVSPRELTHDFLPVRRISDNAYGLYDLVAGKWCPNGSAIPFLAGNVVLCADRIGVGSVRSLGQALSATLTRGWTGAADVYAVWGSAYGGVDTASWEHTQKVGAFAENDTTMQVKTPDLGRDATYLRFYTADGKWSETVYLPDYKNAPGFVVILR